ACFAEAYPIGERSGTIAAHLRKAQIRKLDDGFRTLLVKAHNWEPRKPEHLLHVRKLPRSFNERVFVRVGIEVVFDWIPRNDDSLVETRRRFGQVHADLVDATRGAHQTVPSPKRRWKWERAECIDLQMLERSELLYALQGRAVSKECCSDVEAGRDEASTVPSRIGDARAPASNHRNQKECAKQHRGAEHRQRGYRRADISQKNRDHKRQRQ